MKKNRKYIIIGLIVVVIIVLIVISFRPQPVVVAVGKSTDGPLTESVTAEGTTRYHDRYVVSAPITGQLTRTPFEAGQPVTTTTVLAEMMAPQLDPRQSEELSARYASALSNVQAMNDRVAQARIAHTQAVRDSTHIASLFAQQATTKDQLDRAIDAADQTTHDLQVALAQRAAAQHDADAVHASMTQTPSERATHPTTIVSPINGLLLRVLEPDARMVPAGTPLFEIGDTTIQEVVIDMLSSDAIRASVGDSVDITVPGVNAKLIAVVRTIEPEAFIKVSPLGIEEKRVNVIARLLDRRSELGDKYRVDASVRLWRADKVLQVPTSALFRIGNDWGVFVVTNGVAKERKVGVGHRSDAATQITSGLNAGETVILHPSSELSDGLKVQW